MQKRWAGRNVNLDLLCRRIETYLENERFHVAEMEVADGRRIVGVSRQIEDLPVKIVVKVLGPSDDFSVEFLREEDKAARLRTVFGSLLTLFGGGFLLLQDLKRKEVLDRLEKFERDFFVFVEEMVEKLSRSRS